MRVVRPAVTKVFRGNLKPFVLAMMPISFSLFIPDAKHPLSDNNTNTSKENLLANLMIIFLNLREEYFRAAGESALPQLSPHMYANFCRLLSL